MAQVADCIRVEVVGGAFEDGLRVGIIEFGYAGQCFATLPFVVRPIHGQDVQNLAGFHQIHVVTEGTKIPEQDGARLQSKFFGDHEDRITRLDGVLGHILARPGGYRCV